MTVYRSQKIKETFNESLFLYTPTVRSYLEVKVLYEPGKGIYRKVEFKEVAGKALAWRTEIA